MRLLEAGFKVEVIAECIDGDVARIPSGGAGGLWFPYLCEQTERMGVWANDSRTAFEELMRDEPEASGVAVKSCWQCYSPGEAPPPWAPDCPSFRLLSRPELEAKYGPDGPGFDVGDDFLAYAFDAPIIRMGDFLAYLRARIAHMGGVLKEAHVSDVSDPSLEAAVVVNCAGLGNATELEGLERDAAMKPVRGQIIHIKNRPHLDTSITVACGGESAYFIPRGDFTILGGTADEGAWDTSVNDDVIADILARCGRLMPAEVMRDIEIIGHWVGLRPFRSEGIRLDSTRMDDGRMLVRNYGHGGAGITLCWGCADEVVRLATA